MSDGLVEPRPPIRFYCYRCSIVYEDVQQELNCPFCSGGFVEQVDDSRMSFNFNDANMSNVNDSNTDNGSTGSDGTGTDGTGPDSTPQTGERLRPMLNDLGILMSGGRSGTIRNDTLMEQLIWMINGARPDSSAVTAGAPFVLVGAPGDYVFGGEGLNSVVAQLLGQLENSGPPPLTREQIAEMPSVPVTAEEAAANTSCSICWENFLLDEKVSHLECEHMFHTICISPWLQLHATCPICRRNLMPEAPPGARQDNQPRGPPGSLLLRIPPALANRVVVRRRMVVTPGHSSSSTSSTSAGSSTTDSRTPGADSGDCSTAQYNTDIDYD